MARARASKKRLRSAPRPRNELFSPDLSSGIQANLNYREREAAALLRVSASTLRNWRCRKLHPTLKFKKIGGRVIYTGSALLAYVNGN
jgi:hypothetical protein